MSKNKILVLYSNYYQELAAKQLSDCIHLLEQTTYDYRVENVEAGTYEIPSAIRFYHHKNPFDAYIALGLLVKGNTDHYEFIWEHIRHSFTLLSMEGLFLGNGIITAPDMETLHTRVMQGERVQEAFRAVDYLVRLKNPS